MSWRTFVRSHAHLVAAADFFTTEVWTARGLVTYFTLFVIDVATRRVYIAGTTTNPNSDWMEQIARNLTDCEDGFLNGKHQSDGAIEAQELLGGLLKYYHRRAV
jgi:hypothetical protein